MNTNKTFFALFAKYIIENITSSTNPSDLNQKNILKIKGKNDNLANTIKKILDKTDSVISNINNKINAFLQDKKEGLCTINIACTDNTFSYFVSKKIDENINDIIMKNDT